MVRGKKAKEVPKPISDIEDTIVCESSDPLAPSSPPVALDSSPPTHNESAYPDPSLPIIPPPSGIIVPIVESSEFPTVEELVADNGRVVWTREMIIAEVEYIYGAFKKGRLSGGGLKKEIWNEVANEVKRYSKGQHVSAEKCKNKWGADIKEKWKHWKILAGMSGMGFNSSTELYEAYEYVWDNLNKQYRNIMWHKTNVMYSRPELEEILHDSQATGQGAITGEDIGIDVDDGGVFGVIDPQLMGVGTPVSRASPGPSNVLNTLLNRPVSAYNKSKKRIQVDLSDDEDTPPTTTKKQVLKVDMGVALSSLSTEIKLSRSQKSISQQAVHLLESKYGTRLDLMEFIRGCTFFKDEGNAGIFLAISDEVKRDRWLEISLEVELQHVID